MRISPVARRRLLPFLLAALLPLLLFWAVRSLGVRADQENLALAEQNIRRAAVQCYALEGFYPADFDYLCRRYGVVVNQALYLVHYQYVASNLIPDIAVFPLGADAQTH